MKRRLFSISHLLWWCVLARLLLIAVPASGESDFAGTACGPIATTEIQLGMNLDATIRTASGPFSPGNPQGTSDFQQAVSVTDALGNAHPLTLFFSKFVAANVWEWNAALPPSETNAPPATPSDPYVVVGGGYLSFSTTGDLIAVTGNSVQLDFTGGTPPNQPLTISFGPIARVGSGHPTSQYAAQSAVYAVAADGLPLDECRFASFLKIDVQPHGEHIVSLQRDAVAWVAVYGSREVPVRALSRRSLRFGPNRVRPLDLRRRGFWRRHMRDLNGDGVPDLLLRFPARKSGLVEPRATGCLEGLVADHLFVACEQVSVCGPFCLRDLDPRMLCGPEATTRVNLALGLGEGDATTAPFDPSNAFQTSSFHTPIRVFDSLGGGRMISLFISRISSGLWEWSVAVDPSVTIHPPAHPIDPFVLVASGELEFDASGALVGPGIHPVVFDFSGGPAPTQRIDFDFAGGYALSTPTSSRSRRSHVMGSAQDGQAADDCRIEVVGATPEDGSYRPEDRTRD